MHTPVSHFVKSLILLKIFPLWPAGRCEGEEAAEGRKCEGGAGNGSGRASYTIQTCDPSVSRTAVRWGPRFSSSAPPQIPRSFLRSFSLWARHPAETSELNVRLGAAEFFPVASRQMRGGGSGGGKEMRGRRREWLGS